MSDRKFPSTSNAAQSLCLEAASSFGVHIPNVKGQFHCRLDESCNLHDLAAAGNIAELTRRLAKTTTGI